jgi:peptidoglycan hydrolase-like protein with peptidoglycan-binding domain
LALGSGYASQTGSARVRALQRHLDAGGYTPGPIDGRYGPLTKEAVTRFQLGHQLQVDGIAGPQTLTALTTVTPVLYPGAGYQQDHGSPAVRDAQRRLAAAKDAPGPIDGLYGPLTTRAVERFQRVHHLAVDGIVGSETWRALREATRPIANRPTPRPAPTSPPAPKSRQAPQTGRPHGGLPSLPVTFVLLALAALGVMTAAYSYARTRSRMRRAQAQAPHQERQLGAPAPAMRKTETRRRT